MAERRVGRYVLDDLVAENAGTALWRATDPALQRPVGVRLVPLSDPRAGDLKAGALAAAGVVDRRLVKVLDVLETDSDLGIVTEWVAGRSWSEVLTEQWTMQEVLVVALEVGRALESAHAAGVAHGRIRADSVMISDTREVRLRGLGVDAGLWGSDESDRRSADLHGVGALLYAGVTMRWPGTTAASHVHRLSSLPPSDGRIPAPSTLVAEADASVDRICRRSMLHIPLESGERPYSSVAECVRALDAALSRVPVRVAESEFTEQTQRRTDRLVGRVSTAAIFIFALAGLGLLGWQVIVNLASEPEPSGTSSAGSGVDPIPIPPFEPPLAEQEFSISSTSVFDPYGDGIENDHLTKRAVDAKPSTAWLTSGYATSGLDGKPGVGLVVDMGTKRPFRAINLKLHGTGTDFQILASNKRRGDVTSYRKVVEVTAAGDSIKIRSPRPVRARYVLLWFTGLPYDGSYYVGGVRDVKIVG